MKRLPSCHGLLLAFGLGSMLLAAGSPAAETPSQFAQRVLQGAKREVERGVTYDAGYVTLPYPAGDVPWQVGACTDLVTRAYRHAGIDLQKEVHEDRVAHRQAYPRNPPGEKDPNTDIDHRRCRHMVVWFRRHAQELATDVSPGDMKDWQPGDVVFFKFGKGDPYPGHVGIVSDVHTEEGTPFIVDNFPPYAGERFSITSFPVIDSHFRWPEEKAGAPITPHYASGGEPPAHAGLPAATPAATIPSPTATPREIAPSTLSIKVRGAGARTPAASRTPARPQGGRRDGATSSALSIEKPGPRAVYLTPGGKPVSLPDNPLMNKL